MPHYMMATTAIHQLGDISREKPDLCIIEGEEGDNYVGRWVKGFGFVGVKFPKATTRELTEEEKDRFDGMQIAIGDNPPHMIVRTREPAKNAPTPTESPVIRLPDDETRVEQLKRKLAEYKERLRKHPFRAPEQQMDTICKIAILERLLEKKEASTWELSRELAKQYGSGFSGDWFNNACTVISDYCQTGGAHVRGGTGLKQ